MQGTCTHICLSKGQACQIVVGLGLADGREVSQSEEDAVTWDSEGMFAEPWWAAHLTRHDGAWWLRSLDASELAAMPARQRVGFLNAAADLLRHLVGLLGTLSSRPIKCIWQNICQCVIAHVRSC
jgi:hypothetical protein